MMSGSHANKETPKRVSAEYNAPLQVILKNCTVGVARKFYFFTGNFSEVHLGPIWSEGTVVVAVAAMEVLSF